MRRVTNSALAASLIGGLFLGLGGGAPVSAATLPMPAIAAPGETAVVEQVQQRRVERRAQRRAERRSERRVERRAERRVERRADRRALRRYEARLHGQRFRHRRHGFDHFYSGYWYSTPWWIGPSISFGLSVPANGSAHVEWCLNRYRSYDPASDTYLGFDGLRHRCNSPYG